MAGMRGSKEDDRTLSDSDLIRRCSKGSPAHRNFYRRYFSFAMSICIRYTRDQYEAMEIVNDSYMKVLSGIKEFDVSGSFRSWYGKYLSIRLLIITGGTQSMCRICR